MRPTLTIKIGDKNIIWFKPSNKYIVLNSFSFELVNLFLTTSGLDDFKEKIGTKFLDATQITEIYEEIKNLLTECNEPSLKSTFRIQKFRPYFRNIEKYYKIDHLYFKVYFSSEAPMRVIHPQISHLEIDPPIKSISNTFDVLVEKQTLYLYKNEQFIASYSDKDYHILQGKFAMELLCAMHRNTESDWIGTFHASTITNGKSSIMLIGNSGSGKSTFTAMAMQNGYYLVADDFSPMLSKDTAIYCHPAGVSIKSGSFKLLNLLYNDFEGIKKHFINPYKGFVRYIPPNNNFPILSGFPCTNLVLINYNKKSSNSLAPVNLEKSLDILISESWLSPHKENAQQFLIWLKKLKSYQLNYSDNEWALKAIDKLF